MSTNTSPARPGWANRMNSAIRRTTMLTSLNRPPSVTSDNDNASLNGSIKSSKGSTKGRQGSISSLHSPPLPAASPPPITESPLRKATATAQETVSPSPAIEPINFSPPTQPIVSSPPSQPTTSPEVVPPTVPPPVEETQSPTGYVPPPVIDSTAGNPGAFTDLTDELPQPDIALDPHAPVVAPVENNEPQSSAGDIPPPILDSTAGNSGTFNDMVELPQPVVAQDPYAAVAPVKETESSAGDVPPPVIDSTAGNPGSFNDMADELPQPVIAPVPRTVVPVEELQQSTEYIPPPVIDSAAGNYGSFNDMADELPPPVVAQDPSTVAPVEEIQNPTEYIPPPVIDSAAGNLGAFNDMADELPQPVIAHDPQAEVAPVEPHVEPATVDAPAPAEPQPIITEGLVGEPGSFFDGPMSESVKDFEPGDHLDHKPEVGEAVDENAKAVFPEPHHGEAAEYYGDVDMPTPQVVHEAPNVSFPEPDSRQPEEPGPNARDLIPATKDHEETEQETQPIPAPAGIPKYDMPSYPANEQNVWGGEHDYGRESLHNPYDGPYSSTVMPIVPSSENVNVIERSPAPSIRMPEADPFADPIAPRITVSQPERGMPQPFTETHQQGDIETHRDAHVPVMPLPSFFDVSTSKSIHQATSSSSLRNGGIGNFENQVETDETLPLLSRPVTPTRHKPTSYLQSNGHSQPRNLSSISPLIYSAARSTASNGHAHSHHVTHPKLHALGWQEYHLPDGTIYYVHQTNKVTTEINLRSERMLNGVELFLADHGKDQSGSATEEILAGGGEVWLRDVGTSKSGMVLERWLVDHRLRTVVMSGDGEHGRKGSGKGKAKKGKTVVFEEDQLDTEYRYWSFMEAHPAHNPLPAKAKLEAMDVLTWAWTERLLPSHRSVPAPFTQEECQELMTLIRSFGDHHHDDHGIQTRIISRVLLRVAHWRQSHFRPNKALPLNVGSNPSRLPTAASRPFRRAVIDFLVSILFLGIPYIYYDRTRLLSNRIDEESTLRSATPTLVIGACTCLVAAVVLSASVTFLSLPGLDAISRTTGIVAILCAAFSMAATVVAIFKHKADLERPISHLGVEGMMVITRRTVILSLPLVLLIYSMIAFVTSIVVYSLRGVTLTDPSVTRKTFEDYTRWGVVSVVGVLAGMVVTSMLLFKR